MGSIPIIRSMVRYKADKNWDGLVERVVLRMGRLTVDVDLWMTQDALQANLETDDEFLIAAYVPLPNRNKIEGIIGELHFCKEGLSLEAIGHEITHLILDVYENFDLENEAIAQMAGRAFYLLIMDLNR